MPVAAKSDKLLVSVVLTSAPRRMREPPIISVNRTNGQLNFN